jgi:hypothetical protein
MHTYQSSIKNVIVEQQPIHADLLPTSGQSSDCRFCRIALFQNPKDILNRHGKWISEQEE